MMEIFKLLGNNLPGDKVGFLCQAVRKVIFAVEILSIGGNRGSGDVWGKDAVLKLIIKRDAGAQGGPELWVGLCYGASNCKDEARGIALCYHEFGVD